MIQKVLHIFLAILVLSSSSGLVINKHYCLDHLVSVAVMSAAEKCHVSTKEAEQKSPQDGWLTLQRDDCCKDVSSFIKVNQEQKVEPIQATKLGQIVSHFALLSPLRLEIFSILPSLFFVTYYKPPLLVWDRPVRLQTFLC